eukprot:Em0008g991a
MSVLNGIAEASMQDAIEKVKALPHYATKGETREIVCTRKVMADVVARGLNVTEVAHDFQSQVTRFVTDELRAINSYDTWHANRNKSWFTELSDKMKSTKTHLYWCMKNCTGNADDLRVMIMNTAGTIRVTIEAVIMKVDVVCLELISKLPRDQPCPTEMAKVYASFFELDDSKLEGVCKVCKAQKGTIVKVKYSASSKTNLKSHFTTHHKDVNIEEKASALGARAISQHFNPQPFPKQEELTAACTNMIVDLNLPISIVERHSFRNVLAVSSGGRYKPVCRSTMRDRIIQKGNAWTFQAKDYMAKYGKPSTTVDLWTSRARRGQMAVSIHLNTEEGLDTKVLDFVHIPHPHTAENISQMYEMILARHGLDVNDTFKTVCDTASNMKKAFDVSLWEADDDDEQHENNPELERLEEEADPLDEDLVQDIEGIDYSTLFGEQYRQACCIHILQLFVKDCLQLLPDKYKKILRKAKVVCKKSHQSPRLSEMLSKQLPTPGETRWNAQYRLLVAIQDNFEEVKTTIGMLVDSDLEERHIPDVEASAPFKAGILDAFSARKIEYFNLNRNILCVLNWKSTLRAKLEKYLSVLVEDCASVECEDGPPAAAAAAAPSKNLKQDCAFDFFGYDNQPTKVSDWKSMFDAHMASTNSLPHDMDPLQYWRVPASSAPVERIFSHAGLIVTAKRTRMADDLLSALVKANVVQGDEEEGSNDDRFFVPGLEDGDFVDDDDAEDIVEDEM